MDTGFVYRTITVPIDGTASASKGSIKLLLWT